MKKMNLGILLAGVLMITTQAAQAHDFLPDMKSGVWLMDKLSIVNAGENTAAEIEKDQDFNIDYFLGSPIVCQQNRCTVERSASSGENWIPAAGEIKGDQLVLTTVMSFPQTNTIEVKTEKYIRLSDSLVMLQGSIKNKRTNLTRVSYSYVFKKVGN